MCNCCGQRTIYQTKLSYLVLNYLQNNFFRQKILSFTKYIVDYFPTYDSMFFASQNSVYYDISCGRGHTVIIRIAVIHGNGMVGSG